MPKITKSIQVSSSSSMPGNTEVDEIADSLRQANPNTGEAAGEKRPMEADLDAAAKKMRNPREGLEADDSSDGGGLNGEDSDPEGEDLLARFLRPEFFDSAMQLFNERRLRHPAAWSVDRKYVTPRPLDSFATDSILMAATAADDFIVFQVVGRQADGGALVLKIVARALDAASAYRRNYLLGDLFSATDESNVIALLVARETWPKFVKKIAKFEAAADFSVGSVPGNSDGERVTVRLEMRQQEMRQQVHIPNPPADSVVQTNYPATAHLLHHAVKPSDPSPAEAAADSLEKFQKIILESSSTTVNPIGTSKHSAKSVLSTFWATKACALPLQLASSFVTTWHWHRDTPLSASIILSSFYQLSKVGPIKSQLIRNAQVFFGSEVD